MPPSFIKDDESDDDDDDVDIDAPIRDRFQQKFGGGVKNVMNLIKNVPSKLGERFLLSGGLGGGPAHPKAYNPLGAGGFESKSLGLAQSMSNISNINPLEDPFSDAGQTPLPKEEDSYSFSEQSFNH